METCLDGIEYIFLVIRIKNTIIVETHEGPSKNHFLAIIILHKILINLFWWPKSRQDVHYYCK